jgi:carboxypeptidase PM20D1
VALSALLLVNTLGHNAQPRGKGSPASSERFDEHVIGEHLAGAIRFRTVSHQDPKDDDRAIFAAFRAFLETTYPAVHRALTRELIHGDGLLYRWQGSDPSLAPVLFLAHQDVVPVEPGTEAKWTHPPFDGVIADGFVWGRGAIDDKGSLVCLFEAFESLLSEGWKPARSVWFASGFDEEVGGREGAKEISRELARRGLKFAWVVDEGSGVSEGVMPGVERPIAGIAVSEKGYLSIELVAQGEGGHSSMPPPDNAIGLLAAAIGRLQASQFAPRLTPTLRQSLETLAPETPFLQRLLLSNLWLTAPLVVRELAARKESSPMVRTTTAPTILQAGVKENVVPSSARAIVNFRILPGDSIAQVMTHVRTVIADDRIAVNKLGRTVSEPAPLSSTQAAGYKVLEASAHKFFPDAVVIPNLVNGATDSRHFQAVASNVYRFVPRVLLKSDLKRIHGTDERSSLEGLVLAVRAYRQILRDGAARSAAE